MKAIIIGGLAFFVVIVLFIAVLPFFFGVNFGGSASVAGRGVFMSEDGGLTWEEINNVADSRSNLSAFTITDFAVDPGDSNKLYAGTKGNGLWRSGNLGENWEKIVDGSGVLAQRSDVFRIDISRANPKLWFLAVYQKNRGTLLKSEDGGRTFEEVYFMPVERFGVFDVWFDDASGSVFIVTGQGGLLESGDRGKSWRVVRWFADGLLRFEASPAFRSTFYVLTSGGRMFKTTDRGGTWLDITSNFDAFDKSRTSQDLTITGRSGKLYLSSDYGLLSSRDGGSSWERVQVIIPPEALPVLAVAFHPFNESAFFISAKDNLYKTADGGFTWSIVPVPELGRITKLVIDKNAPSRMYMVSNR